MDGVGGSTFVIPGPDWVLVELPMPEMRSPRAYFSAYVEAPFNALAGKTPDDPLPIQGVAWDKGTLADYVDDPVIAFPFTDVTPIANVGEEEKIFSLLVDLRSFAADTIIDIGLYGFIETYYIVAGHGTDGPFSGDVFSSEFYGAVTRDYRGLVLATPGNITGAPRKLFIKSDTIGFGHDRLIATFPGLVGVAYEYLTDGEGDKGFFVAFDTTIPGWVEGEPFVMTDALGHQIVHSDPTGDPDAFIVFPPTMAWIAHLPPDFRAPYSLLADASIQTTIYWDAESTHEFTKTMFCSPAQLYEPGTATYSNVSTFEGRDDHPVVAFVWGFDQVKYYVPTWVFTDDRPVPVNVAGLKGTNLWTEEVRVETPRPDYSWTWETEDYPDRPEMAEIGTGIILSQDPPELDDIVPSNHFAQLRIGTLRINRSTGEVRFLPVEADPVDGGETGDGPDGDGTAPGRTANPQLRVWTYSLDGHDYYVLRLGDFLTLVYDDYSEQWMNWTDFASLTWRAHCGINWSGAEGLADTYGSNVLVGDDTYGILWFLDPNQPYDDASNSGDPAIYFSRVTVGQIPMTGRNVLPCYAAWLTTDMGDPAYLGAGVTLYTSDDAGVSWDNQGFVGVTPGENSPELAWYSLGQIEAPGRLFKIFDNGAITRIDALEMNDPDDQK